MSATSSSTQASLETPRSSAAHSDSSLDHSPHSEPRFLTPFGDSPGSHSGGTFRNPLFGTPAVGSAPDSPISSLHSIDFEFPVRTARRNSLLVWQFQQLHLEEDLEQSQLADEAVAEYTTIMARSFLAQYDGTMGVEGITHLHDYEKHVRQNPPAVTCPALRVRTEIAWFAHSYESDSPFQSWCESELYPILDALDTVIRDGTQAAKQTAAADAANDFQTAKDNYRQRFCRSNLKDLQRLLTIDFSKSSSTVDLIKAVNRCKTLYTVNASRLPPQDEVVELILDKMPPHLATRVALLLAPLPDDDNDKRYSFKNVSKVLGELLQSREGMLWLQSAGTGAPAAGSSAAADYNNLAGGGAAVNAASRLPQSSTSNLAFSHLNDVDKCRALAAVSPHGICPIHLDEPHALKDCPFVVGSKQGAKPRRHLTADAHAAAVSDETLDTLTEALTERLQHVMLESVSNAFAAHSGGYHSQQQHGHGGYRQPYSDRPGFGRGQGSSQQLGFRPLPPPCDVCGASSHPTSGCWVLRPDKCQDQNTLVAHYNTIPAECKPMFLANLKRYGLLDAIAPQLQALGADVFPPRPDSSNKDGNSSGSAAAGGGPRSYFGMAGVDATFAGVLSNEDLHDNTGLLGVTSMAATVGQVPDTCEASERCGACGYPCDCIVKTGHDSMGQIVWQCPQQSSSACTADKPVSQDHVIHACVARYAGSLPVSFAKADSADSRCMVATRSQQLKQQQQQPEQLKPVGDAMTSAEPVNELATHAPASSSRSVPEASHSNTAAPPSNSSVGPSASKRNPVSFAPVPPPDKLTGIRQAKDKADCSGSSVESNAGLNFSQGYVLLPMDAAAPYLRKALGGVSPPVAAASTTAAVFAGGDVWFDSSAYSVLGGPRPRFDAATYRKQKGGVCRLAQYEGKPQDCVFIGPSKADDSSLVLPRISFADSCADNCFMRKSFAKKHGIAFSAVEGSMMHMRAVGGVVSRPTVTTELVQLVFRRGTPQEHRIVCNFIVIDDDCLPYDVILGTPVLHVLACSLDFMTDTMVVRYRYYAHGDSSSFFTVPLITTEPPSSDQRSAIVDPAIAAAQVTVADSDLPVTFSVMPGQDSPLFTTCCTSSAMAEGADDMQIDGTEEGSHPATANDTEQEEMLDFEDDPADDCGDATEDEANNPGSPCDQGEAQPSDQPASGSGGSGSAGSSSATATADAAGGTSSAAAAVAAAGGSAGPSNSSAAAAGSMSFADAVVPPAFEQLPPELQGFARHRDVIPAVMQGFRAALGPDFVAAEGAAAVLESVSALVHFGVHGVAAFRQLPAEIASLRAPDGSLPAGVADALVVNLSQLGAAGAEALSFVAANVPGEFSQQISSALSDSAVLGAPDRSALTFANFTIYGTAEPSKGGVDAYQWCRDCGFDPDAANHLCGTDRLPSELKSSGKVLTQVAWEVAQFHKNQRRVRLAQEQLKQQQQILGSMQLLGGEVSPEDIADAPLHVLQKVIDLNELLMREARVIRRDLQLHKAGSSSSSGSSGASSSNSGYAGGGCPRAPPPPPIKPPGPPGPRPGGPPVPFPLPLPPGCKPPRGFGPPPPPPPRPPPGSPPARPNVKAPSPPSGDPPAGCKPGLNLKRSDRPDWGDEPEDQPLISRRSGGSSSQAKPVHS